MEYGWARVIHHLCDCGLLILFVQPEYREVFEVEVSKNPNMAVIVLDQETAKCPKCGQVYDLPPAEVLDVDRIKFGQWVLDHPQFGRWLADYVSDQEEQSHQLETMPNKEANKMHDHEWYIFSTIVDQVKLLARCECGAVGTIAAPTGEEWEKAFHALSKPYRWNGPERVELLPGFTTAWDTDHHVWTVIRG